MTPANKSSDCLCIIQDDAQDWEREASTMGDLYMNSYLTVAAANSTNSYTGCFPKRKKGESYISSASLSLGYNTAIQVPGPDSCTVGLSRDHGRPPSYLHVSKEWMPGSCSNMMQKSKIGTFGREFDPIADEPLSSRGMIELQFFSVIDVDSDMYKVGPSKNVSSRLGLFTTLKTKCTSNVLTPSTPKTVSSSPVFSSA